jgi:hypothetical protein
LEKVLDEILANPFFRRDHYPFLPEHIKNLVLAVVFAGPEPGVRIVDLQHA